MNLNPYKKAELISKYIQEELSDQERVLLEGWLRENEENQHLFDRLQNADQVKKGLEYFDKTDVDSQWKIARRAIRLRKVKSIAPFLKYAAAFIGVMFALFLCLPKKENVRSVQQENLVVIEKDVLPGGDKAYLKLSNGEVVNLGKDDLSVSEVKGMIIFNSDGELDYSQPNSIGNLQAYNTLTIPKKGTYRIVLSDGTKVWLNSLSQLNFPVQFARDKRTVELTGEAYFEVAKDPMRPFIVAVGHNQIEVLGTHFTVNSYGSNWSTTLIEGSVKVSNQQGDKLLFPGEEAKIIEGEILIGKGNIKKALAWKNNEFYFKNESMGEILEEVARWYDFKIDDRELVDTNTFSGTINRNINLSEVLKILNVLSGYQFHFDGEELFIKN